MRIPELAELEIRTLGEPTVASPLEGDHQYFVDDSSRIVLSVDAQALTEQMSRGAVPSFEVAGPRRKLFFKPREVVAGIVTCGGLCPGLNDVIRSVTLTLLSGYGAKRVWGFRYGYAGLASRCAYPPLELNAEVVDNIQEEAGTILGSSRGPQDPVDMVDTLVKYNVQMLFVVGGDGTQRGGQAIVAEIERRKLPIAVIGIPKTIDNDLSYISLSFGFMTAVNAARQVIQAAHTEAKGAMNGIGLVKLMGRQSGFIAAHATLATSCVNFCLVPEVPFCLDGENGFLSVLERRLERKTHAVIVAAEGAGQDLLAASGPEERDASGNVKLKDIGLFLKSRISEDFKSRGKDLALRYFDPSYLIRSVPDDAVDSEFCLALGQSAVHAAMSGRTNMVVGYWNRFFTHVPTALVVEERKVLDPNDRTWQSVLAITGQPHSMC